jgi:hypothetical protein
MRMRELKNRGVAHIVCVGPMKQILRCTPHSQDT